MGLLQLPLPFVAPQVFDRYLLALLPGAFLIALPRAMASRLRLAGALGVLFVFAGVCIGLMHDCHELNAARWRVGRRALARGIPASEIEGGFEWNGWFGGDAVPLAVPRPSRGLALLYTRMLFPQVSARYAISPVVMPGTTVVDAEPCTLWLAAGDWQFFLIRDQGTGSGN
jgi:hypothetical protein